MQLTKNFTLIANNESDSEGDWYWAISCRVKSNGTFFNRGAINVQKNKY